jgi:demethylmenaquinone methyltransferase/2-methoxy-6-polyprenyl-1,4-benzoquinol methylase
MIVAAMSEDDDLLADQRAFYRRRAPTYDEWWLRRGRYYRGEDETREWQAQVDEVAAALESFQPRGEVLELAGGTGWWTQRLAETAGRLTVVDSSPETLGINQQRVGRPDVSYVIADLFSWRPPTDHTFDVVFFSFWLSHVPRSRFTWFWDLVSRCLVPEGRVFFVDNRRSDPAYTGTDPYVVEEDVGVQRRRLSDGSEHRVVKLFYEPDELARLLGPAGWVPKIFATPWFIYGSAQPLSASP